LETSSRPASSTRTTSSYNDTPHLANEGHNVYKKDFASSSTAATAAA
jgi:hypothetical protein